MESGGVHVLFAGIIIMNKKITEFDEKIEIIKILTIDPLIPPPHSFLSPGTHKECSVHHHQSAKQHV